MWISAEKDKKRREVQSEDLEQNFVLGTVIVDNQDWSKFYDCEVMTAITVAVIADKLQR